MGVFASYNTSDAGTGNLPLQKEETREIGPLQTGNAEIITGSIFTDQGGTLFVEQSFDGGAHYDISTSHTITASQGVGFEENIIAPIARVRYVNGSANQTVMRLFIRCFVRGK